MRHARLRLHPFTNAMLNGGSIPGERRELETSGSSSNWRENHEIDYPDTNLKNKSNTWLGPLPSSSWGISLYGSSSMDLLGAHNIQLLNAALIGICSKPEKLKVMRRRNDHLLQGKNSCEPSSPFRSMSSINAARSKGSAIPGIPKSDLNESCQIRKYLGPAARSSL